MDCIQWTVFNGLYSMDCIQWTVFNGLYLMDSIQWTPFIGLYMNVILIFIEYILLIYQWTSVLHNTLEQGVRRIL